MTVPTNTDQTFTQTNIREDLEDLIYNVDPFRTPVLNMAKKGEAKQTFHEWDVDALAAQNSANAAIQGDNPTNIQLTATGRMGNYTQISNKTIQLSGTLQAVVAAGGTNKMGYQLMKKAKELKRDMEGVLTSNTAKSAGNSTTAAYSAGMASFIATNDFFLTASSGANPTGAGAYVTIGTANFYAGGQARTDNGTTTALTEANLKTVVQSTYKNSGDCPEYLVVSPANKQIVSTFTTTTSTRFVKVEDALLQTKIDTYESDFGDIKVIPDIFLARSRDAYGLAPNYLRVDYLRPFQTIPLAKTGDSDQKMLLTEYCLEVCNEHAHYAIYDTTG